ncbi:MAG TPA: beta-ketoacyl-[acyl-carrier-protein] synthase family protein [Actinomycetota bacterium]|jgi:3-oxoacyl-[acyl-carrier-protein] synthase II|nr:beta-ketoacyl-[acyl-carrier-protein] synthase family protein [Actinomycetota bacterium]
MNDVWITGMGAVTPLGWGVQETWNGVSGGRSGVTELKRFDTSGLAVKSVGTVPGFEAASPEDSLVFRYASEAAREAIRDAGLSDGTPPQVALVATCGEFGLPRPGSSSTIMGVDELSRGIADVVGAPSWISTFGQCAASLLAVGTAMKLLRSGRADVAIAGGADCLVREWVFINLSNLQAMSIRPAPPEKASCPFDKRRDGFVLSEGAGFVVLETAEHAMARGATAHAVVEGFGCSQNAYNMVASPPDGSGAALAMKEALRDAGTTPDSIDYVNAHGTSTPTNDSSETTAIRSVLGSHADKTPVSSSKSELGHLMSAAGAVELIVTVRALQEQLIPPTINLEEPDPDCDLDYVSEGARKTHLGRAMTNSFGFGGHNASVVLGASR